MNCNYIEICFCPMLILTGHVFVILWVYCCRKFHGRASSCCSINNLYYFDNVSSLVPPYLRKLNGVSRVLFLFRTNSFMFTREFQGTGKTPFICSCGLLLSSIHVIEYSPLFSKLRSMIKLSLSVQLGSYILPLTDSPPE